MAKQRKLSVKIKSWNGAENVGDFIQIVEEVFAQTSYNKIYLYVPHNRIIRPEVFKATDNTLNICIWSSVSDKHEWGGTRNMLCNLTNHAADAFFVPASNYKRIYFIPPPEERVFLNADNNYVGEYLGDIINDGLVTIAHDVVHLGNEHHLRIFKRVMQATCDSLQQAKQEEKPAQEIPPKTPEELLMEQIVAELNQIWDTKIQNSRTELEALHKQLQITMERVNKTSRDIKAAEQELARCQKSREESVTAVKREMSLIARIPGIVKCYLTADEAGEMIFNAETDMIYASSKIGNATRRFKMGTYHIQINIVQSKVILLNTSNYGRRHDRYHHPHTSSDGHTCWGTGSSTVCQLLTNAEYAGLVTFILSFLRTFNYNDILGRHITEWDEVDEQNRIIKPGPGMALCERCQETVPSRQIMRCEYCGKWYCKTCASNILGVCNHCHETLLAPRTSENLVLADEPVPAMITLLPNLQWVSPARPASEIAAEAI